MTSSVAAKLAMLNGPAMAPPPGIIPDFVDPPHLGHSFILVLTLGMSFATGAVLLRMLTKFCILHKVVFEDYVIVLGWLLAVVETVPSGLTSRHGGGAHQWNVPLKEFFQMLYWVHITTILYGPTLFMIKFSILLQYLRVFVPSRKANMSLFVAVHSMNMIIFIFYLLHMFFMIFLCRPREKYWNRLITTGSCYDFNTAIKATGFFNVLSDFIILLLPISSIWRLQISLQKKLGILAVFATGILACVASILRSYYTYKLVQSEDVSYNMIIMGWWTYVEIDVGIVITCLPVLPRLFKALRPRISDAISLRSKRSVVTNNEPKPGDTPNKPMSGKKKPDNYMDLYSMQTEVGHESSPLHQRGPQPPGPMVTNDSSRTSLTAAGDCSASRGEDITGETKGVRILRTTHIVTEIESGINAANNTRADLERQQLSW